MSWQTTRPYLERAYQDGLTQIKAEKEADVKGLQTYNQAQRAQSLNQTIGVSSSAEIIGTDAAARAAFRQKIDNATQVDYPKHVKARTDTEAKRLSETGRKEAQYLPELKGKITDLETKAIWGAVDRGMVFKDGQKFYFFYKFEQPIGYNNGKLTQWVRVEWSSGNIHGHPTNLETVRKNFPNVEE